VRRWTLLLAGAALWLFLAAIPALADGGPHVASTNSGAGSGGLTADSCAGCHRAHTAQGVPLLIQQAGPALCLVCHSQNGAGATTDVETGLQYKPAGASGTDRGVALGALRGGGFIQARIASSSAVRIGYANGSDIRFLAKVPVGAPTNVTSAHLPLVNGKVSIGTGTAWGNGPDSTTPYAGPVVQMDCVSCHNPHGNGQYRILKGATVADLPSPAAAGTDVFVKATAATPVTDNPAIVPAGDARNYTVIQTNGGTNTLLASDVSALSLSATAGDYWRRKVPWNASSGSANDAPNGDSANFGAQISAWCLTCHSRYLGTGYDVPTTDNLYKYRHTSNATSRNCITCHVAHGSDALMTGPYSSVLKNPGGSAAPVGDSRLLKVDNRGTCQLCHDPTHTIVAGQQVGPTPAPVLP
jgi:predicted CXXCH cytochrome family protein